MYDTINMKRCFVCGGLRPLPTCSSGQTGSGHCHHVGDGLGKQGHTGLRPLPNPHPNLSRSLALCRGLACARSFHTHTIHIHTHPCTYTCLCRWRSRCSRPWRVVTWNSPRWRPTAQSHSLSTIRCACITTRPFFSLRKAHVRAVCVCVVCAHEQIIVDGEEHLVPHRGMPVPQDDGRLLYGDMRVRVRLRTLHRYGVVYTTQCRFIPICKRPHAPCAPNPSVRIGHVVDCTSYVCTCTRTEP